MKQYTFKIITVLSLLLLASMGQQSQELTIAFSGPTRQNFNIVNDIYAPYSDCLGNCAYCSPSQPLTCLNSQKVSSTNPTCMPLYKGSNCQQRTLAYQTQTPSAQSFAGWNLDRTNTCQLVTLVNGEEVPQTGNSSSFAALGPLDRTNIIFRNIGFAEGSSTNRLVLKFSVAVSDAGLVQFFTRNSSNNSTSNSSQTQATNTQTIQEVLPNGTIIFTTITTVNTTTSQTTTNNQQTTTQTRTIREWMLLEIIDTQSNSAVVGSKRLGYDRISSVRTSCGYVYQFQVGFDLSRSYTSLGVRLSMAAARQAQSQSVTWNLLSFQSSVGCRGYVVSSGSGAYNCNACLSGFYPSYSRLNGMVEECRLCDSRCKTCINANGCLSCSPNTFFNVATGMCEFSENFRYLNGFEIVTGNTILINGSNSILFGQQVLQSQGGVIQIKQLLNRGSFQPYTISFDMLYSSAFRNSGQIIQVIIGGQTFNFSSQTLPLYSAAILPGISGLTSNIYQSRISYTINSSNNAQDPTLNSEYAFLRILTSSNINTQQAFGIKNVNFVQFQCSSNCFSCNYSQFTQISVCTKCNYFFDIDSGCQQCANGYYLVTTSNNNNENEQSCIKCHSTCRQCSGPSISDCSQCQNGFQLGPILYEFDCINCLSQSLTQSNSSKIASCRSQPLCLIRNPLSVVLTNEQCKLCLNSKNDITQSQICRNCWIARGLARSSCQPIPERGYRLFGSDISNGVVSSQWKSNKELSLKTFSSLYADLYGVNYISSTTSQTNVNSQNQTTILTFTEASLPQHRGLTIFFNIFKINRWGSSFLNNLDNQSINILIRSASNTIVRNQTIRIDNSIGHNIFDSINSGNQMMYTFYGQYEEHTNRGKLQIIITSTHTGIYIKDMQFYLGNCNSCSGNRIDYQIYYIPMYSTNDTQTGIDVWLEFNQDVEIQTSDRASQQRILNSFQFSIDQIGYDKLLDYIILENRLDKWDYVKYFIPLDQSLLNATLRVNNSLGYNIYSKVGNTFFTRERLDSARNLMQVQEYNPQATIAANFRTPRLLLNERLSANNVQQKIKRYQNVNLDQRSSMKQLEDFFEFFQWFTLITMIVFAFFGIGIIFEEFSILIQLLFLHIYVSTNLLPASFKRPLAAMQKMENLNFFAYPHAQDIQQTWFDGIMQNSPFPFTQYNVDVYFARSIYAVIIINLIYLGYFIILFALLKVVKKFKNSPSKLIKFFRDIPQRPLNYFDQIWRYQFITIVFAAFIQFHNFDGDTAQMRTNLALCIIAFIIVLIYPVFVMIYTYRQHLVLNVQHFLYLYNDIYYRKISSIADKSSYYIYIAVRFGRYLFFALFIAIFIYQDIIGPVILMAFTLIEIIYVVNFKIFRDKVYMAFKVIENIGFIILEILLLIVYGFSDHSVTQEGFQSLGYGIAALYVLMIINGIIRFIYLFIKKFKQFKNGKYDYGQKGQLENYDNRNPVITLTNVPTTQRGLTDLNSNRVY